MVILNIKLILALILTAIPFAYAYYVRPRKDKPGIWRNGFTFLSAQWPWLKKAATAIGKFFRRMYDGMRRSDTFRKFYILMVLLVILAYQYIDFHTASDMLEAARNMVENSGEKTAEKCAEKFPALKAYIPFITSPYATITAAVMGLSLFSYRIADWMFTKLHDSRKTFFGFALAILVTLTLSPRIFIIAETMFIILMAAFFYPDKRPTEKPLGRKRIPREKKDDRELKMAA